MKKVVLSFFVFVFIQCNINAQEEYSWNIVNGFYFPQQYEYSNNKNIKNNKVKSIEQTEKKKGELKAKKLYTFNSAGKNDSYTDLNKKGKVNYKYLIDNSKDDYAYSYVNSKNKEKRKEIGKFDSVKNHREVLYYKNSKLKNKVTRDFYNYLNKDNKQSWNILKSEFYKKGGAVLCKRWEYAYYPDNSKKTSTLYNAKGKIKYVWNYDCKSEGELVQQHKDTTLVCKKDEFDEKGNRVVTERKFNEKGEPTKIVTKYSKDNKLLSYDTYNEKNVLITHISYTNDMNWEEIVHYNTKGVETYRQTNKFDEKGNKIEEAYFSKQKPTKVVSYEYNDKNLIAKSKITKIKKNNKKTESEIEYVYTYYQ
ncbi:MAG: hypothetical protein WCK02_16880 [Bacteroidota bacterium]